MSMSRTVDAEVVCSVRYTSKSSGRSLMAVPAGRRPGAFSSRRSALPSVPRRSRWNGSPNSNGFEALVALAAVPRVREPVRAERVAVEAGEQLVEDLLPDPPIAARGELEAVAVALEVAGALEAVGEVLERIEVPGRIRPEQVVDVRAVDLAEVARATRAVELRLELVERLEPAQLLERSPRGPAAGRR